MLRIRYFGPRDQESHSHNIIIDIFYLVYAQRVSGLTNIE